MRVATAQPARAAGTTWVLEHDREHRPCTRRRFVAGCGAFREKFDVELDVGLRIE